MQHEVNWQHVQVLHAPIILLYLRLQGAHFQYEHLDKNKLSVISLFQFQYNGLTAIFIWFILNGIAWIIWLCKASIVIKMSFSKSMTWDNRCDHECRQMTAPDNRFDHECGKIFDFCKNKYQNIICVSKEITKNWYFHFKDEWD